VFKELHCANKILKLGTPQVMGILNVTPDSFSDGGQFATVQSAIEQTQAMLEQGAAMIDVGGESTRPGAAEVSVNEELDRVIPVIEKIASEFDTIISIDTSKPEVIREATKAGAGFINDVNALQTEGALLAALESKLPICLMHMQGVPRTMQTQPEYNNVTDDVIGFLEQRVNACIDAGIQKNKLLIDPGFGFGKTLKHNLQLMHDLVKFKNIDCPLLVGVSRKSMIGQMLDVDVDDRVMGSVALETLAAWQGANIIRAHDVKPAVEAIKVAIAVKSATL